LPFGLGQPGQRLRPAHARQVGVRQPAAHLPGQGGAGRARVLLPG
jgi:hypothetical protein